MKATLERNGIRQKEDIYDVIISGAGPVGLFLACELALAKCSVLILEKAVDISSPLKQIPFGIRGLSAPSIEALNRRGLLQELELHKRLKNPHQNTKQGPHRLGGHFAGIPFRLDDIDNTQWQYRLPTSTEPSLISEMQELEIVLTRRAIELGIAIKRGHEVSDFQQSDDQVTVQSGDQTFIGKWLVGCDGSRSIVRKVGGFEFAGTEPAFTGYSSKVTISDSDKLRPGRNLTATGMYLQSQPDYIIIQDFDDGAFHKSGQPISRQHLQAVLRRVSNTDVTISALHTATTWTDRARQATAYRDKRVLLAGDAAHIHAPLGGQGLNLGLGDAMNLGWKLSATIHDTAPDNLLDSYFSERYPIGEQVLDWSRAQVAIMKPDPSARALNAIFRDIMDTRNGATYFAARVWGLSLHYDLGGDHPLVGYSAPNFGFEDGATLADLMHQGAGVVLDFDQNDSLEAFTREYGHQLRYIARSANNRLGLSALLIRPDGIVAWASNDKENLTDLQKAATQWFLGT